jgi:hypothetical protein
MKKVIIGILGIILLFGVIYLGMNISQSNNDKSLKAELNDGAVAVGNGQTELGLKVSEGGISFGNSIGVIGSRSEIIQ